MTKGRFVLNKRIAPEMRGLKITKLIAGTLKPNKAYSPGELRQLLSWHPFRKCKQESNALINFAVENGIIEKTNAVGYRRFFKKQ